MLGKSQPLEKGILVRNNSLLHSHSILYHILDGPQRKYCTQHFGYCYVCSLQVGKCLQNEEGKLKNISMQKTFIQLNRFRELHKSLDEI
jgi:hypothetical protein